MAPLLIGGRMYRIRAGQRNGRWTAYAVRLDNGDRFGGNFWGDSEATATAAVTRWLEWQTDHVTALEALQEAERAYHRSIAGHAFASAADEPATRQARRDRLAAVERAQARLDEVRARKPEA